MRLGIKERKGLGTRGEGGERGAGEREERRKTGSREEREEIGERGESFLVIRILRTRIPQKEATRSLHLGALIKDE